MHPSLVHTRWGDDAGLPTESVLSDNPLPITYNPLRWAGSSPGMQTPTVAGEAGVFGGPIPNRLALVGHLKSRQIQDNVVSMLQRGRHHPRTLGQRGNAPAYSRQCPYNWRQLISNLPHHVQMFSSQHCMLTQETNEHINEKFVH